jgi:hypothetical protein
VVACLLGGADCFVCAAHDPNPDLTRAPNPTRATPRQLRIRMWPRRAGFGVTASPLVEQLCGLAGIRNITVKLNGRRRNVDNVVKVGPGGHAGWLWGRALAGWLSFTSASFADRDIQSPPPTPPNPPPLPQPPPRPPSHAKPTVQAWLHAVTTQTPPHDGVEGGGVYLREVYHRPKLPFGLRRGVDVP